MMEEFKEIKMLLKDIIRRLFFALMVVLAILVVITMK